MAVVANVRAVFKAKSAELEAAAKRSSTSLNKFGKEVQSQRKRTEAFNKASGAMRKGLVALGAAAAGVFTVRAIADAAAYSKQIELASIATNESVADVQKLGRVFNKVGIDIDTTRDILQDVTIRVKDASLGTKTYVEALDLLGLKADQLKNKGSLQQLATILAATQTVDRQTAQFALDELLGDQGKRLAQLDRATITDLSRTVANQYAFASAEEIEILKNQDSSLKEILDALQGIKGSIIARLIPNTDAVVRRLEALDAAIDKVFPLKPVPEGRVNLTVQEYKPQQFGATPIISGTINDIMKDMLDVNIEDLRAMGEKRKKNFEAILTSILNALVPSADAATVDADDIDDVVYTATKKLGDQQDKVFDRLKTVRNLTIGGLIAGALYEVLKGILDPKVIGPVIAGYKFGDEILALRRAYLEEFAKLNAQLTRGLTGDASLAESLYVPTPPRGPAGPSMNIGLIDTFKTWSDRAKEASENQEKASEAAARALEKATARILDGLAAAQRLGIAPIGRSTTRGGGTAIEIAAYQNAGGNIGRSRGPGGPLLGSLQFLELQASIKKLSEVADRAQTSIDNLTNVIQSGFENILETAISDLSNLENAFKSTLRNIIIQVLREAYIKPLSNFGSNIIGDILGGILPGGNLAKKKRARGGPVLPGASYLVGEEGEEIFSPSSAGSIIPNAGNTFVVNVAPGVSEATVLRAIQAAAPAIVDASVQKAATDVNRPSSFRRALRS